MSYTFSYYILVFPKSKFFYESSARTCGGWQIKLARICQPPHVLRERPVMSKRAATAAKSAESALLRMGAG